MLWMNELQDKNARELEAGLQKCLTGLQMSFTQVSSSYISIDFSDVWRVEI